MNNGMYSQLGRTGLCVSRVALGCGFRGLFDTNEAEEVINRAIDRGINLIDCANVYELRSHCSAETVLGKVLTHRRNELVVTTKYGASRQENHKLNSTIDASYKNMAASVEESLKRLGTDHIDVLFLHMPEDNTTLEELAFGFNTLIQQGKVLYAGLCNHNADRIEALYNVQKSGGLPTISVIQNPYNLLNRNIEEDILPLCGSLEIGAMVYSPVAAGLLSGDYATGGTIPEKAVWHYDSMYAKYWEICKDGTVGRVVNTVAAMAKDYKVSSAVLAQAWTLRSPYVTSFISGAETIDELKEATDAVALEINDNDLYLLNHVSKGLCEELTIPSMKKKMKNTTVKEEIRDDQTQR